MVYRDKQSVIFQNLLVSKSDKAPKQDNLCKTKVGEKVGIPKKKVVPSNVEASTPHWQTQDILEGDLREGDLQSGYNTSDLAPDKWDKIDGCLDG